MGLKNCKIKSFQANCRFDQKNSTVNLHIAVTQRERKTRYQMLRAFYKIFSSTERLLGYGNLNYFQILQIIFKLKEMEYSPFPSIQFLVPY